MLLLILILLVIAGALVLGYRQLAAAVSTRAANGVLLLAVGVGAVFWLLGNVTS